MARTWASPPGIALLPGKTHKYPWPDWFALCESGPQAFRRGTHFSVERNMFRSAAIRAAITRGLTLTTHVLDAKTVVLTVTGHRDTLTSARHYLEEAVLALERAGTLLGTLNSTEMSMTGTLALQLASRGRDALAALE
jgi:hypothetical protein